ncbi:MAG: hypothetical protein VYC34_02760, partial [Planctomycetota bacterium]|nr:hypothetical protein [Planctomycetota bacterium]
REVARRPDHVDNKPTTLPIPMPRTPRAILIVALIAAVLAAATTPIGVMRATSVEAWLALGFEVLILLAAVFGFLVGLGKFRASHAMALACVAGTIFVAGFMSFFAAGQNEGGGGLAGRLRSDTFTLGRIGLSLLFAALAGLVLISRKPGVSFSYLWRAAALGALPLAAMVALVLPSTRAAILDLPPVALAAAIFAGFFVLGGLASASAHCAIRAFEVGRVDPAVSDRIAA